MPLFIDLTPLSASETDSALEYIYKSSSAGGGDDGGIWKPHESALIRRLIELFTRRGLDRLDEVHKQLLEWQAGAHTKPSKTPVKSPGMMGRWSQSELDLAKLYLESLPVAQWTLDDHMMSVDYVIQRYLPEDELYTESEWLATRAGLMGKVEANIEKQATVKDADKLLAALPSTIDAATSMFPTLSSIQRAQLEYGRARCAENVRALAESVRHKMRNVIMQHAAEKMAKEPGASHESLQTRLLDEFGTLNRDWRRIAVTEAGEAKNQGYIASMPPGAKVKRVEQYDNACSFCRRINGRIAEVVSPDHPEKDGETQVWPGKTNIGRSASPRKRVGDQLVPRSPDEMWWLPAGTAHPHCRGRWVKMASDAPGDDPEFGDWLRATLSA